MIGSFNPDHFAGAGMGLGLGLLVGIQRGWSLRDLPDGTRFAGIRTFGLVGLVGGIAGALFLHAKGPALIVLAAAAALIVLGYRRTSADASRISGTGSMVALITLACGFIAATGEHLLATTIVVATVLLLSLRSILHAWVSRLEEREVLAIARFAVIALVILPLLPSTGYGPYNAWNPRQLWAVVVMVSGFSFAGYFAAKWLGATRGILATAAAGAMVSSTAVTASVAARLKRDDGDPAILAAAISTASVVMFLRVLVLVAALAPNVLAPFARLMVGGMVVSFTAAAWYLRRSSEGGGQGDAAEAAAKVRNPFDIGPALLLTVLVMALTVAARWVLAEFGDRGLAVVLAISGSIDVDSAIITMGGLPEGALAPEVAGAVLAVPIVLNTLFKAGIALSVGGWRRGILGAWPLLASAAAVGVSWLVMG